MPDSVSAWCWLLPAVVGIPLSGCCRGRCPGPSRRTGVPLLTRATRRPATGPRPSGRAVVLLIAGLALPQFVLVIDGFVLLWFTPAALLVLGYKSLALRSTGYSVLALFAALNLIGRVCIA